MKRAFAVTGVAIVLSLLLSSPSLAQTSNQPLNARPTPAPEMTKVDDAAISIDDAILMASTPEERAAVLRRCAGPPPRLLPSVHATEPASEPAEIVAD